MEIKSVHVITANPTDRDSLGSCEIGYYTVSGGLLTMVSNDGAPLRDPNNGERITVRLNGESEKTVAKRLTLQHWQSSRGDETSVEFNRPIHYPKAGWA